MLISIIGDSYKKIIDVEENTKFFEKLKLILLYEKEHQNKMENSSFLYLLGPSVLFKPKMAENNKTFVDEEAKFKEKFEIIERLTLQLKENLNGMPTFEKKQSFSNLEEKLSKFDKLDAYINRISIFEEKMNELMKKFNEKII